MAEIAQGRQRDELFRGQVAEELKQLKYALANEKSKTERLKRELDMLRPKKVRVADKFLLETNLV
jgi:hypothetical protein